jgi:mannose-1-phosphate guanylyltransferase
VDGIELCIRSGSNRIQKNLEKRASYFEGPDIEEGKMNFVKYGGVYKWGSKKYRVAKMVQAAVSYNNGIITQRNAWFQRKLENAAIMLTHAKEVQKLKIESIMMKLIEDWKRKEG